MSNAALSRRSFLQAGGATAVVGVGLAASSSPAGASQKAPSGRKTVLTYALDPVGGGESCVAAHAQNAKDEKGRKQKAAKKKAAQRKASQQVLQQSTQDTLAQANQAPQSGAARTKVNSAKDDPAGLTEAQLRDADVADEKAAEQEAANDAANKTQNRLSTGTRINQASDDPAEKADQKPSKHGSCAACGACRKHATNKVFRTKAAADAHRAHKGCRCAIVRGMRIEPAVAEAVFGKGDEADLRDPDVGKLLGKEGVDDLPVPIIAGTAPVILLAGGAAAYWFMRRRDAARALQTVPVSTGPDNPPPS